MVNMLAMFMCLAATQVASIRDATESVSLDSDRLEEGNPHALKFMTFNVEEFFEPCFSAHRKWVGEGHADSSIAAFAAAYNGYLSADYLAENGAERSTWEDCKQMSNELWTKAMEKVRNVISAEQPDIVFLQELAITRTDVAPIGYNVAIDTSSGEEGWKDRNLANAVMIKSSTVQEVSSVAFGIAVNAPVPRAAACSALKGVAPKCFKLKVCSLHLVGGRFDDERWASLSNEREQELQQVIDTMTRLKVNERSWDDDVPLILAGDFNAQVSERVADATLKTHPEYRKLQREDPSQIPTFLKYMSNGHSYLKSRGFSRAWRPLNDEEGNEAPLQPTSRFGTIVDWIYFPEDTMSVNGNPVLIDAVSEGISDHNAVLVELNVPPQSC